MIAIYEPLYLPGQRLVEPAFLPLRLPDNSRASWREFGIIVDMYRRGMHRDQALTGLLSPKFGTKTGITGSQFIAFIEANPGADVYFINPYPQLAYLTYNVWTQGESAHSGLVGRAQALLDGCGIRWDLEQAPRQGPDATCYCNYWVGTEKFWDDYVGGVLIPIARLLETEPESDAARGVMANTQHLRPTPFLPFIIERLFSTYLSLRNPSARPYRIDPVAHCANDFERDIVMFVKDRVTRADREGDFPPDLKQWMRFLRRLRRRFAIEHHSRHPYHDTGYLIPQEAVEASERDLAREAVVGLQE
jgi:hypothetical protein